MVSVKSAPPSSPSIASPAVFQTDSHRLYSRPSDNCTCTSSRNKHNVLRQQNKLCSSSGNLSKPDRPHGSSRRRSSLQEDTGDQSFLLNSVKAEEGDALINPHADLSRLGRDLSLAKPGWLSRSRSMPQLFKDEIMNSSSSRKNAPLPMSTQPEGERGMLILSALPEISSAEPSLAPKPTSGQPGPDSRTPALLSAAVVKDSRPFPTLSSPTSLAANALFQAITLNTLQPNLLPSRHKADTILVSTSVYQRSVDRRLQIASDRLDKAVQVLQETILAGVRLRSRPFETPPTDQSPLLSPLRAPVHITQTSRNTVVPEKPKSDSATSTPRRSRIIRAFSPSSTSRRSFGSPHVGSPHSPRAPASPVTSRRWQTALHAILSPSPSLPPSISPGWQDGNSSVASSAPRDVSSSAHRDTLHAVEITRRVQTDFLDAIQIFGKEYLGLVCESREMAEYVAAKSVE